MKRFMSSWLLGVSVLVAAMLATAGTAAAAAPQTCSGSPESPGILAGTYSSNVLVSGVCFVNSGPTTVDGNLTLLPGSALVAVFGGSNLTVMGNVHVQSGATLIAGCNRFGFRCLDNPNGSSSFHVFGNLTQTQSLGVVLHGATIDGNVTETGGGGGFNCNPSGIFAVFGSPVFSVYDGTHIGGNVTVVGLTSCWLGIAHSQIAGSVHVLNNQLADPDAVEILNNTIGGNLICEQNTMVWDSFDPFETLYPRVWAPNTVNGNRVGQCVTAPPLTPGGASPGQF